MQVRFGGIGRVDQRNLLVTFLRGDDPSFNTLIVELEIFRTKVQTDAARCRI